MSRRK